MKYKGKHLGGPRKKIVPIIRDPEEGGNIFFVVKGVTDLAPFEKMCPTPKPPEDVLPGGKTRANLESPVYKEQIGKWWAKRSAWIAITSLRDSPDITWEQVKWDEPETWTLWNTELMEAGFADGEVGRILTAIMEVNGLNEGMLEEARQSFLTTQAEAGKDPSSPPAEASSTQPGTPASDSASALPDTKK